MKGHLDRKVDHGLELDEPAVKLPLGKPCTIKNRDFGRIGHHSNDAPGAVCRARWEPTSDCAVAGERETIFAICSDSVLLCSSFLGGFLSIEQKTPKTSSGAPQIARAVRTRESEVPVWSDLRRLS